MIHKKIRLGLALLLGGIFPLLAQLPNAEQAFLEEQYRYLHAHPELSFQEKETATYLSKQMRDLGWRVIEPIGGYGLAAILQNGDGPTVMVRTDTDALPITEQTGLPYASTRRATEITGQEVGVMHACGHDVHMTVWLGTARQLTRNRDRWHGTLVFIAQPAEERGSGARAMLEDGLFDRVPTPDYAVALHTHATLPAGTIGYSPGFALANVDMVDISVRGRGGHGAYPHTTIDPVVLAARLVLDLQTIVSREISPLEPAVVTVGSIHGGSKGNIIPDEVKLELTLRSYSDEVRNALIEKIRRISRGVGLAAGLPDSLLPAVSVRNESIPSTYNDPTLVDRLVPGWKEALGEGQVRMLPPVMGGEDFGVYGRTEDDIPICIFWLGSIESERATAAERGKISLPSLHSPHFAPEPGPTIATGVAAMTASVRALLE